MPTVFVSHSGKDDRAARGLEAWLTDHGFTDIFVDHASIAGGEKWAQALRDASGACRVVICLVTERWLASDVQIPVHRGQSFRRIADSVPVIADSFR